MPDDVDDQSNDQNNDQTNWRRDLEAKARRADELAVEVETLKREAVFSSALTGIDHPGLGYFKDGYKGDLTPEAIRAAAVNAGFATAETAPTPPPSTATPPPTPPDLAAHQRIAAAATGAAPPPPFNPHEAVAAASSPEEVMAIVEAHGEKLGVISSRLAQ